MLNDIQDMLLDIELEDVVPRAWRRFRVSAGITLRTLQDKVCQSSAQTMQAVMPNENSACYFNGVSKAFRRVADKEYRVSEMLTPRLASKAG